MTDSAHHRPAALFFPHARIETLAAAGRLELDGAELAVGPLRYRVSEAVRVLDTTAVGLDARGLCGQVRRRAELCEELGAELLGDSMLLDDVAYDVVAGLLAEPLGTDTAEARGADERARLAAL